MNFKTKDLLVTVLPKLSDEIAKYCLLHSVVCRYPSINCIQPCSLLPTCGHCSVYFSCLAGTCGHCSVLGTCGHCSVLVSGGCGVLNSCGPGRSACDPTIFCPGGSRDPFVIQYIEDIVALRAELQQTLERL